MNGGYIMSDVENLWAEVVTIPAGGLAAVVNTSGRAIVGIIMPAAWTAANIGYDVSIDNVTFNTAYDNGNNLNQRKFRRPPTSRSRLPMPSSRRSCG